MLKVTGSREGGIRVRSQTQDEAMPLPLTSYGTLIF